VTRGNSKTLGLTLLVLVTVIWGTTFPIIKDVVGQVSPGLLIAGRFLVAAVILVPWLSRVEKRLWLEGGALGVLLFFSYWTQVMGLTTIGSGRAAFITGLNVIMVPLLLPFLRQRVPWTAFVAAAVAIGGIGLMSLNGFTLEFSVGDAWILACAVLYAVYIIVMDRLAAKYEALPLTAVQVATVCLCGLIFAAPELLAGASLEPLRTSWVQIVYLGVIATALTTLIQSYAQRFVPAFQTAVIYALEPVWAAVFSFWWLKEMLTAQGFAGAGLILVAMVLCQFDPGTAKREAAVQERV
jgi:drug/metabolite transporter (DMT)-like permease